MPCCPCALPNSPEWQREAMGLLEPGGTDGTGWEHSEHAWGSRLRALGRNSPPGGHDQGRD